MMEAASRAVAVAVASVYQDPDGSSPVVTQALLNTPAEVLLSHGVRGPGTAAAVPPGWARIRLSDYEGWIEISRLAEMAVAREWQATILPMRTTIYADSEGDAVMSWAYATTVLPADEARGWRVHVQLPGGARGWVDASAVELLPAGGHVAEHGAEVAVRLAEQLLGTPYLWGGTTMEGIDCSGLTQLCCRAAGVTIPRDADQQYHCLPYVVERADLHAGDLIYFASYGKITHTALMIDPRTYIHAKGSPQNQVMLTGLEPGSTGYDRVLAGHYAGARRPFTRKAARILV